MSARVGTRPPQVPAPVTVVLWDMDGTLCESGPFIVASMAQTLRQMGIEVPVLKARGVVGPPIRSNFAAAGVPIERLAEAVEIYRGIYPTRSREALAYPGIEQALAAFAQAGVVQAVATSKAQDIATRQLGEMGLAKYFSALHGSQAVDGWSTPKSRVIAAALADLTAQGADLSGPVMVGDRIHDIEGAAEHDIASISVRWGYGTVEEWDRASATALHPDDLVSVLGVQPQHHR